MLDEYSKNINMQDIGLFWQFTIKTIDDLRIVGNENLTLEMYIIQLIHLKNIDERKELSSDESNKDNSSNENLIGKKFDEKQLETNIPNQIKNQLKNTNQIKTSPIKSLLKDNKKLKIEISNFQDLINQANKEKEIELKYDLERNVKLVSFNKGTINISFNEKLNKNFIKTLTEKLLLWTGERWIISLSKNTDAKSIYEKNLEDKNNKIEEFKKSKIAQDVSKVFPDAQLIDIKDEE
jgi:DNA polymerase-3 subunit gamma/tau